MSTNFNLLSYLWSLVLMVSLTQYIINLNSWCTPVRDFSNQIIWRNIIHPKSGSQVFKAAYLKGYGRMTILLLGCLPLLLLASSSTLLPRHSLNHYYWTIELSVQCSLLARRSPGILRCPIWVWNYWVIQHHEWNNSQILSVSLTRQLLLYCLDHS